MEKRSSSAAAPVTLSVLQADHAAPQPVDVKRGELAVFSAGNPLRPGNQDGALVVELGGATVLAVADGMGGAAAGALAAELTLDRLQKTLCAAGEAAASSWSRLRSVVLDGLEQANADVCRRRGVGGATIVIAVIYGNRMRCIYAGDSQALVVGQRGIIKMLTTRHSPVGYAVEAGVLDLDEALFHPLLHVLSNAVGSPSMYVEVGPELRLLAKDTVLLATDGLFDNLFVDDVAETIRKGKLMSCAATLCARARARMEGKTAANEFSVDGPTSAELGPKKDEPDLDDDDFDSDNDGYDRLESALLTGDPQKPDDLTLLLFRPGKL
jgi:serine/threonine protein phosphatase PrpC